MKALLQTSKYAFLFIVGGLIYYDIEIIWRGYSHPLMIVVGGICFITCGLINEIIPWEMPLPLQCLIGGALVTAVELVSGAILNLWMGLGIWDYSGLPLNLWGQICLPFSCAWVLLAGAAIILDDYLRYWLFDGEKPHYRLK